MEIFEGSTIEFLLDGSTILNGTKIRRHATSTRPLHVHPDVWTAASPTQKADERRRREARNAQLASMTPALPRSTATALPRGTATALPQGTAIVTLASATFKRNLLEVCCSPKLSDAQFANGCECVRVALDHDMTTDDGLSFGLNMVKKFEPRSGLVWFSIPCTVGCPWWIRNRNYPAARLRHNQQLKDFHASIQNVIVLIEFADSLGHKIAFEWPRHCRLWKHPLIQEELIGGTMPTTPN